MNTQFKYVVLFSIFIRVQFVLYTSIVIMYQGRSRGGRDMDVAPMTFSV